MKLNFLKKKIFIPVIAAIGVIFITSGDFIKSPDTNNTSKLTKKNLEKLIEASTISPQQNPMITGELSNEKRALPLYGFNGNNTIGTGWQNSALISKIQALNIRAIRYPGGTVSDWWDWKKGWFVNQQNNTSSKVQLPAKFSSKDMDVDELPTKGLVSNNLDDLKFLVNKINCQVIFVLNMISSNLNDQIAMLKTAQSKGINVKYIEMGNEVNLQASAGAKKYSGPKEYGDTCKAWITEIKKAFPQSEIAVVGGNENWDTKVTNWNRIVLNTATNADAIVLHAYPSLDSAGIGPKKLYNAITENYDDQGFDKIPDNIKIWITEYNIVWTSMKGRKPDKVMKFAGSWGQALGIILQTSTMSDLSKQASIMLDHNLTGNPRYSAIETTNQSFNLLPNGIGMQAWLTASANMTTMQKITFKDRKGQIVPDYMFFGWKFSNGSKNSMLVVNLTPNQIQANLKQIGLTMQYSSFSSGISQQINSLSDVTKNNGNTTNGSINSLPYSVSIINM